MHSFDDFTSHLTSNPITTHEYLVLSSIEEMKRLSQVSEETVALDIMIGIQNFSLHEVPSIHDLKVTHESRLAVFSIFNQDYPFVQAITLIIAVIIVFSNLAVDIPYGWLDPRIRYR